MNANLEPRAEPTRPRCPLCNEPTTKLEPVDCPSLPPGVVCLPCNVFATEPYAEWNLFVDDIEQ